MVGGTVLPSKGVYMDVTKDREWGELGSRDGSRDGASKSLIP